jgi:hypothetical protein
MTAALIQPLSLSCLQLCSLYLSHITGSRFEMLHIQDTPLDRGVHFDMACGHGRVTELPVTIYCLT